MPTPDDNPTPANAITRGEFLAPDPLEHFARVPDYFLQPLSPEQYRAWQQTYQQAYQQAQARAQAEEARFMAQFEFDQGAGI